MNKEEFIDKYNIYWRGETNKQKEIILKDLDLLLNKWISVEKNYNKLIMAVESKYPNETRHETALRYIKEREKYVDEAKKMHT